MWVDFRHPICNMICNYANEAVDQQPNWMGSCIFDWLKLNVWEHILDEAIDEHQREIPEGKVFANQSVCIFNSLSQADREIELGKMGRVESRFQIRVWRNQSRDYRFRRGICLPVRHRFTLT